MHPYGSIYMSFVYLAEIQKEEREDRSLYLFQWLGLGAL